MSNHIAEAAQNILALANSCFPTLEARQSHARRALTQFESICHAKFLLGTIPRLLTIGDEKRSMILLGQAQGLLFSVGIEDRDAIEAINDRLVA